MIYRLYAVRGNVSLGSHVHLGIGTIVWASRHLVLGDYVYIGKFCTVEVDGLIGNHVLIGNNVGLVGREDHDMRRIGRFIDEAPWIGDEDFDRDGKRLEVIIGDDVWIGYGSVVLSGVSIGRGAVVAAGSIVSNNVGPYEIVAGNPARLIGRRFTAAEASAHENLLT